MLHLNGSGSVPQIEEALRCLGQYLGLESTRPDKEHDTGPDVLWMSNDGFAVVMEVKTDKLESSRYTKSDLGQLRDHVQWVSDRYETTEVAEVFVGPLLAASDQANPSLEMVVIELEQFGSIGKKLVRHDTRRGRKRASAEIDRGTGRQDDSPRPTLAQCLQIAGEVTAA